MCTDQDVTRDVQKKRIKHFKKRGDQHFTDDGRRAEITVDLVLQAKAKMSENKVSEMIKQLLQEEVYFTTKCCQECFIGQILVPSSWKIVRLVSLRKPDGNQRKGSEAAGHRA